MPHILGVCKFKEITVTNADVTVTGPTATQTVPYLMLRRRVSSNLPCIQEAPGSRVGSTTHISTS
jgi:hypothetical protein